MKPSFSAAVALCLLYFAACERAPNRPAFEATLFTYAEKPRPSTGPAVMGMVSERTPKRIFESNEFWQSYADQNSALSDPEIDVLRMRFSISPPEVFSNHNNYFAKSTIRILDGNLATFESIIQVYREYHRNPKFGSDGSNDALRFLNDRARSIRDDLSAAKQLWAKSPTDIKQEQRVQILQNNLTQIEDRLNDSAAESEQAYAISIGSIAEQFMTNPPNSNALKPIPITLHLRP